MRKLAGHLWNMARLPFGERPAVGSTPADVIHRENKWRLLRYRPRPQGLAHRTPILMVPSLINRWYVLDLLPGKSFVEYLVERGHDVYIIDWGKPGPEDRHLTFDDICDRYLGRAIRVTSRQAGGRRPHLLGYCMGGTLTSIHLAAHPERAASMVCLAAPVDFDDGGLLSTWTRARAFDVDALIDAFGNVPWPLMQASFHMLRPTLNLSKMVFMLDKAWDDSKLEGFRALETWGNDNVSLPGELYRRYVKELYRGNRLIAGELTLSGRPAPLDAITCPVLVVSFEHDHIVPRRSAEALLDHVRSQDRDRWCLPGGHVGAVVSRAASKGLWPKLSQWWAEREQPASTATVAPTANAVRGERTKAAVREP